MFPLEEAIEGGLHSFPPLLIQQLLVVSGLSQHPTPRKSRPFVVWVHLLYVVQRLVQQLDEALQNLDSHLLRHWRRRMLLNPHQLKPLLLQFVKLLANRFQQRVHVVFLNLVEADFPRQLETLETLLQKPLGQVEAPEIDSEVRTELLPRSPDAGCRNFLPGTTDTPKGITYGVQLPMPPHHVLLEFPVGLLGSLSGIFKLIQGHNTLHTKVLPRLMKEMCLEHLDHALIHRLQQRRGVWQQEDKFNVGLQVRQHLGVGGSVVEDYQDFEGEALRRVILLQLVDQLRLAVGLENMARHPTTGVGEPVDRQAGLIITLECTRVLGVVNQDGLEFAVSRQVSLQQEGETKVE